MTGFHGVMRLRRVEKELDELGFMISEPKTGWNMADMDVVAIKPKDSESLPVYARDAQIFVGTIEQLEVWLRGVEWARQYDMLLRVSDDKKRKRKEQDERNRQLVQRLKNEEILRRTK
jgi:hypothetical protein